MMMYRIESAITYQEQESRARPASEYAHAIGCVQSVRNVFGGNGEGYLHFLATIKDFGVRRSVSLFNPSLCF